MNFFSAITIKVEQRWLCIFLIWFANIDMPVSMPWVFSPSLPRMLDCPKSWQPWYATSPFSEKQKSYLGNSGNLIILRKTLLRDRFLSLHLFKNLDSVWSTNQTHSHSGYHLVQIHLVLQVLNLITICNSNYLVDRLREGVKNLFLKSYFCYIQWQGFDTILCKNDIFFLKSRNI